MPIPLLQFDIVLEDIRKELRKRWNNVPDAKVELVDYLPPTVLAFVKAGDYTIYVNRQQYILAKNAGYEYDYLFVILLHEYLHLIGIADEREVRRIDLEIIEENFGRDGLAYRIAVNLADPRDIHQDKLRTHTYI